MEDMNHEATLAYNYIQYTNTHVFLTGKAGTGKTTFLRRLKDTLPKRMIVVAPTGVAAINAGGVTLHSFFQLPFSPFVPEKGTETKVQPSYKFSKEKINIIRSIDLLVIDEISMVRADLLDAVDAVLRQYRDPHQPFGGVQLLLIGDIQQLAPVIKDEEWQLLRSYYASPFFFHSRALNQTDYVTIELKRIYRQTDPVFTNILNQIRENKLDRHSLQILNKRYIPNEDMTYQEDYITLTTHNKQANDINQDRLDQLETASYKYRATITGTFPAYSFPTDEVLELKKGAQVMFVKNDPSPEKKYYNGKIGRIQAIGAGSIIVKCDDQTIVVDKQEWKNTKYSLDPETKAIKETVEGSFVQYPLKTAWAITIHKSQGLTFDKVIINAAHSFAHGQVYVALSRCRSLEGLILSTPIQTSSIFNDQNIESFTRHSELNKPNEEKLNLAAEHYFACLIAELFDYKPILKRMHYINRILEEHFSRLYPELIQRYNHLIREIDTSLYQVNLRFQQQLRLLMHEWHDFEHNEVIQERIRKGAAYFLSHTTTLLAPVLDEPHPESDNKEIRKSIEKEYEQLKLAIDLKLQTLQVSTDGFSVKKYLETKSRLSIENETGANKEKKEKKEKIVKQPVSSDISHPELYERLKKWRNNEAENKNLPVYTILQQKALVGISNRLPETKKELLSIPGIGKKIAEQYGDLLLEIVDEYRTDQQLQQKLF